MVTFNTNLYVPPTIKTNVIRFSRLRCKFFKVNSEPEKRLTQTVPYWYTYKIPGKVSRKLS